MAHLRKRFAGSQNPKLRTAAPPTPCLAVAESSATLATDPKSTWQMPQRIPSTEP